MITNKLPRKIAIFPLSDAIFFPETILPLNIFEKKYVQLVEDCMKNNRLFGMVQPKLGSALKKEVYKVGCLGKIVSFNETEDRRFIISLLGVTRFRIDEELRTTKLYREFNVDYSDFIQDLNTPKKKEKDFKEKHLINRIKLFLKKKNYLIKFDELDKLTIDQLINTTCMMLPFSSEEKQKLIEIIDRKEKINTLEEIININLVDDFENKTVQ